MNRFQKTLIGAVIGLVLLNIVLLGFIWLHRPEGSIHDRTHRSVHPKIAVPVLHKQLNLSRIQREEFRENFRNHRNHMKDLNREFRKRKHEANRAIIMGDSLTLTKANEALFNVQMALERETQKLTAKLAAICSEEQKVIFLQSIDEVLNEDREFND